MNSLNKAELHLEQIMPLIAEGLSQGKPVRFYPRGISMRPMLRQGIDSVVLSSVPPTLKKYDLPLYQRENGQYVLHRIVKVGKTYTCIGDHQHVVEKGLRHDQMIAVVVGFYRDQKYYSVKSPGYWLYCRIWHYSRWIRRFFQRGFNFLRVHLGRLFGRRR